MKPPPANLVLALAATILGVAGSSGCKGSSPSGGDGGQGIPAVDLPGSQIAPVTPCELDLDFGDVPLGVVDSVVFQIENDGDGVLDLSTINPTLDPEFALDAGTLQSIQPGRSDYVTVTFQPTRVGVVTSAFAIQTDGINPRCSAQTGSSTGNIITVALTGNGIQISLVVQPNVLDFGITYIGTMAKKSVLLLNQSTAPVNGIVSTVVGGDAALFVVDNAPASLGANESAPVDIIYSPLMLETRSLASVEFQGDDGEKATLNLFGEPDDVALMLAPNPIDFGFVPLTTTAVGCTTVSNQSNLQVSITGVGNFSSEGGAFAPATMDDATPQNPYSFPSASAPLVIDPGASGKVCFQLTPSTSIQYSGEATLITNDPGDTQTIVQLTGWGGGPQISCTPATADFGKTPTNTVATIPVFCTNIGSANSTTNLILHPPTASPSVFSAELDQTTDVYPLNGLPPDQSALIDVSYAPTATSNDQGTLTIVNNGGRGQPVQIPLSGQGVPGQP